MKNGEIKFETLKKSYKKYFIGGVIAVCIIGGALTFRLTHSKYRFTQSIDLAEGVIHYKAADFQVVAMYINDGNGDVSTDTVPTSGYTLNTAKSTCKVNDVKDDNITINYHDGVIGIDNLSNKGTKCYLYFDKIKVLTVDNILATLNAKTTAPDFRNIAYKDEGIFEEDDPMYGTDAKTYYWRGTVENNHVIFADKCWRIVRINGDKSIRLIYNGGTANDDGKTCNGNGVNSDAVIMGATDAEKYYATDKGDYNNAAYVGWTFDINTNGGIQRPTLSIGSDGLTTGGTPSNAKTQTENWYKTNIIDKGFDGKIANGKFCNDREVDVPATSWNWGTFATTWSAIGKQFAYAGVNRLLNEP